MRPSVALDYRPALLSPAGIGRAVRELARALARRGDVDLHLFGHSLARRRQPAPTPQGAVLHRRRIPGRSLPLLARLGVGADRLAGSVDLFHWTDYVHPPVTRARPVLTVHDLAFLRDARWHGDNAEVLRARTARAVAAAAAVVVPSRATADDVGRLLPAAARVEVIPFGGDHVPRARPGRPTGPDAPAGDYVVCLGTVEPRKNLLALLAAVERLPAPRPEVVIVGARGWQCDDIVAAIAAAEQRAAARWLRAVDDAQVFALLAHARALVYPSLWEGFGFPPLEAMALGVPVVANDCAPLRELCDDAAVLVDATDHDALAAALDRVLRDDALRARLVAAGPARAAQFTWDVCAAAHARLYAELVG